MPLSEFFKRGSKKNSKKPEQSPQAGTAFDQSSSKTPVKRVNEPKSTKVLNTEQSIAVKNIEKIDEGYKPEKDIKISIPGLNKDEVSTSKNQITIEHDTAKEECSSETNVSKEIQALSELPEIKGIERKVSETAREIGNEATEESDRPEAKVTTLKKDKEFEDVPTNNEEKATNDLPDKKYPASDGYNNAQINVDESIVSATEEKVENVTAAEEVEEGIIIRAVANISEFENKSLGESLVTVQSEEIFAKEEGLSTDALEEVNSALDSVDSIAEDKHPDIKDESRDIIHGTENVLIKHDTNPKLNNCKPDALNFEHFSLEEPKDGRALEEDVNNAQVLPYDSQAAPVHTKGFEPINIDKKTVHETNSEENTESLKKNSENTKSDETDIKENTILKMKDDIKNEMECVEKNVVNEDCYVELNLENFESQLATETVPETTTDIDILSSEKETNLYSDMSEKIASESLREAFEELNLILFVENEASNVNANYYETEIDGNGNDDIKNSTENINENQKENSKEKQTENDNEEQIESNKEKQAENERQNKNSKEKQNENEKQSENERQNENNKGKQNENDNEKHSENDNETHSENNDENRRENNENAITFRQHSILNKQDSGLASTDNEELDGEENVFLPPPQLENNNQKWRVGYLQVKLPAKSRGRGKLKAWQKRWVVIQNDEFTCDEKTSFLMLSIYHSESGNSRRHSALFWRSISSQKAIVYRCKSTTHPYAFTVSDETGPLIHFAGNSETEVQEWMAAIRNILWPPNPVMQLEKVLNGNEFDVSFVDNEFSHRAGLLGTYGCLMVTNRKLILNHPQTGHVIQEWYLNTVDKFHIVPQPKEEDTNKVFLMHTSSDSSTGCGELRLFCNDAIAFLKSLAATIHKVLQYHSRGKNVGRYAKELEELAEWLTPTSSQRNSGSADDEEYYKVPRRQVRSLLDIPNFIFDKPICETVVRDEPLASSTNSLSTLSPKLTPSYTSISTFSQDSGISTATSSSDFLNCSQTSFSIGGSAIRRQGKRYQSSSSESSDGYSPPYSPCIARRTPEKENIPNHQEVVSETTGLHELC